MKTIAIIPARFESQRLPGKVLKDLDGQSILQRVYKQALEANVFNEIFVATDNDIVKLHCLEHQMLVVDTRSDHISGTDRIAEVAKSNDADVVINIQGDEPFIEVENIKTLVDLMKEPEVKIGTLYKKMNNPESLFDYNTVKLVRDHRDKILYFSRQAVPAQRDIPYKKWMNQTSYFQHIGLYGFKRETLLEIVDLPASNLENLEKLEQLRWLENGYDIFGKEVVSSSFGIDTEEDLDRARMLLTKMNH